MFSLIKVKSEGSTQKMTRRKTPSLNKMLPPNPDDAIRGAQLAVDHLAKGVKDFGDEIVGGAAKVVRSPGKLLDEGGKALKSLKT